jgi:hypothetical protein
MHGLRNKEGERRWDYKTLYIDSSELRRLGFSRSTYGNWVDTAVSNLEKGGLWIGIQTTPDSSRTSQQATRGGWFWEHDTRRSRIEYRLLWMSTERQSDVSRMHVLGYCLLEISKFR